MKYKFKIFPFFTFLIFFTNACIHRDPDPKENFSLTDLRSFHLHFRSIEQTYTINGAKGGSFTTPQNTVVTIPPNCFVTKFQQPVSEDITITFKDLYKKSDMLLHNLPTSYNDHRPLKSAGEFMIKATFQNAPVLIAPEKVIAIQQPLNGVPLDTAMKPMSLDSSWATWHSSGTDSLVWNTSGYVFKLYSFSNSANGGTWCNSDNSNYFSRYASTNLTIDGMIDDNTGYSEVFLIFQDVNSMVHVYPVWDNPGIFVYNYAPVGLKCTAVGIQIKDGVLYSSFIPVTISENLNIHFNMNKTTVSEFQSALEKLN